MAFGCAKYIDGIYFLIIFIIFCVPSSTHTHTYSSTLIIYYYLNGCYRSALPIWCVRLCVQAVKWRKSWAKWEMAPTTHSQPASQPDKHAHTKRHYKSIYDKVIMEMHMYSATKTTTTAKWRIIFFPQRLRCLFGSWQLWCCSKIAFLFSYSFAF